MTYYNTSRFLIDPINNYADNCVNLWEAHTNHSLLRIRKEPNFFDKQIIARGANLTAAPLLIITSAIDTIIGLGAGIATICTLGMHKPTLTFAREHLKSTNLIVANTYLNILKTINPSFGTVDSLNYLAFRGLQTPGIIFDLFDCAIKIINAWAGRPSE